MGWLITWLLLALLGGLAVLTRRGRRRQPADETLIAALLGPSQPPAARVLPARQPPEEDESPAMRVLPAPQPHEEDEPSPAVAALPAGEGGWLETQLASITAWSERMQKQITASQADPDNVAIHHSRAEVFTRRVAAERSTMSKGLFAWAASESRARSTPAD